MQSVEYYREKTRRLIKRDLGMSPVDVHVVNVRQQVRGMENALLNLPEMVTGNVPLQDAAGNLYFLVGVSDPFGSDVF